ncbi:hypothetical protein [Paenibacillus apiarius]|uniref:hypothetical protein n=1 Tax=Paenibacillus apiarius TaxID=46240 RepID=UPI003B3B7CF5
MIKTLEDAIKNVENGEGWEEVVNSRGEEFFEIYFRDERFHAVEESEPSMSGPSTKKKYPLTTITKNKETNEITIFAVGDCDKEVISTEEAARILYINRNRLFKD